MTFNPSTPADQDQTSLQSSYLELKRSIINPFLWLFSIIAVTSALATLPSNYQSGSWVSILLLIAAAAWVIISTLVKKISFNGKAICIISVLYFYGVYGLISNNISLDGRILLGCFIIAAFIFFSVRIGIMAAAISVATVLISGGVGLALQTDNSIAILENNLSAYISTSFVFILAAFLLAFMMTLFIRKVEVYLSRNDTNIAKLKNQLSQLLITNQRASEEYKKSQRSFEITNQFIEQFSINSAPETVLSRAATYLRCEFGFYFVAVFEPDERNEFAVLKAGTGPEGANLLSHGHRVKLSDIGLISHTFNHSEIRLSPNVKEDINFLANPILPETNSVLTIPLMANQKVIGILDIESSKVNAFSPEDIKILRSCADQLAAVYEKALLKQQLSRSLDKIESTSRQFTQKAWNSHLRANKGKFSYRYKENILEKRALQPIEILQAITEGEPVVIHSQAIPGTDEKSTSIAIPIKLRGQSIGALDIKLNLGHIPVDLMPLIETISDRLAVALENARLLEEIQNKADREHQVGEISSKIRSSPNVEQILRTAVAEIGQSLGASEVSIQLRSEQ
jgi:GAF domain-containing protein